MDIGTRIKSVRGSISQKEFAKNIGVHVTTLQLYETGNIPKGDVLQRIHSMFGVSIDWLLTGEGEPYVNKERTVIPADGRELLGEDLWKKTGNKDDQGQDPFLSAISDLREIFNSKNPNLIFTAQAGINTLQHSVLLERQNIQQSKEIKDLKDECDALKKRLAKMEKQIKPRDPKKESKLRREIKEIRELIKQGFPPGTALPQKKTI